ncbi:MAG TPA: ABC transporter permease subunit [Acidimicrobiales bacterium]|nr:ABC transporter permease subunit [Acidimicrobiales bacterium]
MLWLSFRQFRTQAIVLAAALAALAVVVVIIGSQMLANYHANVAAACANSGSCSGAAAAFVAKYQALGQWLSGLVLVVPGLIGVFLGAPLVARELESGTFRLAWTQSISRARWTLCKLGLLGLASMVVASLCSLLVTWWSSPLDLVVGAGPFAHFDLRGIVPIAYAAFAFALGVAAGAVIRRTVVAMGTTLAVFVGVRVVFVEFVRSHLMTPLTARTPFTITSPRRVEIGASLPRGAWVVSESIVNRSGHAVDTGVVGIFNNLSTALGPGGVNLPGVGSCPNLVPSPHQPANNAALIARCMNQLHLSNVVTYQPASRYWPFQTYESLIFLGLAAAAGGFTLWRIRRLN